MLDHVQAWPFRINIFLAALGNRFLIHSRIVAILVVKHFHNVHSVAVNHTEGGKPLAVQRRIILQIDEELRSPGVGPEVANVTVPFVLLWECGSSLIVAFSQAAVTGG